MRTTIEHRRPVRFLGLLIVCAAATVPAPVTAQELPRLIDRMARVATLYADAALEFTCEEQLTDMRFRSAGRRGPRQSFRFDYFYVFNEDPEQGPIGLLDYRTYSEPEDPTAEPVRLEPVDLGVPAYLTRAYSWIFLFRPNLRSAMSFRLEPDGRALDRPAKVISFAPAAEAPEDATAWTGRMWIDADSYQLLRVVAVKSDDYRAAAPLAEAGERAFLFTHAEVEFDYEKNGLRFPSLAVVEGRMMELVAPYADSYRRQIEDLLERGMPYDRLFRVRQEYREYRFFGVRTEEEVARRIEGELQSSRP